MKKPIDFNYHEERVISLEKFKEIITDPMRVLFEALRYEEDDIVREEIKHEIEEGLCADMKADELTELNVFEYLAIVDEDGCKEWRDDFINEMIDRVIDPQPDNQLITARRLLYDYINLPEDDIEIVVTACDLIQDKESKELLTEYVTLWKNDKKPLCCGIGELVETLYKEYPAGV